MKKLLRNILTAGVFSAAMVGAVPTASALVSLPSPDCGTGATNNCLQFGDFSVYSLALLNFGATGSASNPGPGIRSTLNPLLANSGLTGTSSMAPVRTITAW